MGIKDINPQYAELIKHLIRFEEHYKGSIRPKQNGLLNYHYQTKMKITLVLR